MHMSKIPLKKPILITLFGYPGSGKTYFAKNLTEYIQAVHISTDKLRNELFTRPRFDKEENSVVNHLAHYMTEEFLSAGVSVIYDGNCDRAVKRQALREIAKKYKATYALIWFQIDKDSAFARMKNRDKRRSEDKYSRDFSKEEFNSYISAVQNPKPEEDYLVLSGKHSPNMQRSALVRRLFEKGVISADYVPSNITKPGMVNLVPGRVDESRRNIVIR